MADLIWDWKHNFVQNLALRSLISRDEVEALTDDSNGMRYADWNVARLVVLPKNGDLSLCKNWRGIYLLDTA
jgi:hypothetical protein